MIAAAPILTINTTRTTLTSTSSISITSVTTTTSLTTATTTTTSTSATTSASTTTLTSSTTATSVTTTTITLGTTSNACFGGTTYTTQLLYMNRTSSLSWTQYNFTYIAPYVSSAKLIPAFQNDPGFWHLDDVSVTNGLGVQLLNNGGFESGTLSGWSYCNPNNAQSAGTLTRLVSQVGWYSFKDGSVGFMDYLSQIFSVVPNTNYTIRFWLTTSSTSETYALVVVTA